MKVIGIDEAGRGPIIGPLVIAGFAEDESIEEELRILGVKDSKQLSEKMREQLYDQLIKKGQYKIIVVEPAEIDAALTSEELNLNWLEAEKSCEIINAIPADKAILDAPSNNIPEYVKYIEKRTTGKKIIAEHKADDTYPIVGAASILAKVTRDRAIKKLQEKFDDPLGSGYPSDPITQKFIKKHWKEHGNIMRKSWSTYQKLANAAAQTGLNEF